MLSHNLPETPFPPSLLHHSAHSNPTVPLSSSNILNLSPQATPTASKKVGKWTPEEDDLLRKYVSMYSEKQWKKVSEHIPGRTPIQCLHRWTKILKPGLVKGPWTPEEDQKLLAWVKREGPGKWAQASNLIPGRSGKQCRERWFNNLNPDVKKGNWSVLEDELIFKLYQKHGSSWSKIAKFIPGRTENSIKNRFYSTLRKLAASKNRTGMESVSPGDREMESGDRDTKIQTGEDNGKGEISSLHHEPNILYGLLREITCNDKTEEKKQDEGDMNVKQEEEVEKTQKEAVKMEEEKKTKEDKTTEKKEKTPARIDQAFNLCGEKVVLARNANLPQEAVQETAGKLMQAKIDENDPNFERFVFSSGDKYHGVPVKEFSNKQDEEGFLNDLDTLQKSIIVFCNYNIHDLMSAFKAVSIEPSLPALPLKSDIDHLHKPSPRNLLMAHDQPQVPHITPIQGLERQSSASKQGFRRRQSQQLFDLPQQGISDLGPLIPVSIKIPPLDTKENDSEVRTPKLTPVSKRDLSENISVFPKKALLEGNHVRLPGVLEQKDFNVEAVLKQGSGKKEIDEKPKEEMNGLIGSINDTIEAASMMYSHYLAQITEATKNIDKNDLKGASEKLGPLFQQLYGLESWLRNAKTDLLRLESFTHDEKDMSSPVKFRANAEGDENKRVLGESLEGNKWEQVMKKRKVE